MEENIPKNTYKTKLMLNKFHELWKEEKLYDFDTEGDAPELQVEKVPNAKNKAYEYNPLDRLKEEYSIGALNPSEISLFEKCLLKNEVDDDNMFDVVKEKLTVEGILDDLLDVSNPEGLKGVKSNKRVINWMLDKIKGNICKSNLSLKDIKFAMEDSFESVDDNESDNRKARQHRILKRDRKNSPETKNTNLSGSTSESSDSMAQDRIDRMVTYPEIVNTFGNRLECYFPEESKKSVDDLLTRLRIMEEGVGITKRNLGAKQKISQVQKPNLRHSVRRVKCKHGSENTDASLKEHPKDPSASLDLDEFTQKLMELGLEQYLEGEDETEAPPDANGSKKINLITLLNELIQPMSKDQTICEIIECGKHTEKDGHFEHKTRKGLKCDGTLSLKKCDFQNFLCFHDFLRQDDVTELYSLNKEHMNITEIPAESEKERHLVNCLLNDMREIYLENHASRILDDQISSSDGSSVQVAENVIFPRGLSLSPEEIKQDLEDSENPDNNNMDEEEENEKDLDSEDVKDVENLFSYYDLEWLPYNYTKDPEYSLGLSESGSTGNEPPASSNSVCTMSGTLVRSGDESDLPESETLKTESDTSHDEDEESSSDIAMRRTYDDNIWRIGDQEKAKKEDSEEGEEVKEFGVLPWSVYRSTDEKKNDEDEEVDKPVDLMTLEERYEADVKKELIKIYESYDTHDTSCRSVPLQVLKNLQALLALKDDDLLLARYAINLCKGDDLNTVNEHLGEDMKVYAPYIPVVKKLFDSLRHPNFLFEEVSVEVPSLRQEEKVEKTPSEDSLVSHVKRLKSDKRDWKARMLLTLKLMKDDEIANNKRINKFLTKFKTLLTDEKRINFRDKHLLNELKELYGMLHTNEGEDVATVQAINNEIVKINKESKRRPISRSESIKFVEKVGSIRTIKRKVKQPQNYKTISDYIFSRNYENVKFSEVEDEDWSEGDSAISLSDSFKLKTLESLRKEFPAEQAREFSAFIDIKEKCETASLGELRTDGLKLNEKDQVCDESKEHSIEMLPLQPIHFKKKKSKKVPIFASILKEDELTVFEKRTPYPFGSKVSRGLSPIKKETQKMTDDIDKKHEKEVKHYVEENYPRTGDIENYLYKMTTLFDPDKAVKYMREKTGNPNIDYIDIMLDLYYGILDAPIRDFEIKSSEKQGKGKRFWEKEVEQEFYSWEPPTSKALLPGTNIPICEPKITDLYKYEDAWKFTIPPLDYKKCGLSLKSLDDILGRKLQEDVYDQELIDMKVQLKEKLASKGKEKRLFRTPYYYASKEGRLPLPKESMKVPASWHYDIQRWPFAQNKANTKKTADMKKAECSLKIKKREAINTAVVTKRKCLRGSRTHEVIRDFRPAETAKTRNIITKVFCLFCTFPVSPLSYYTVGSHSICRQCFQRERIQLKDYMETRKLYNVQAVRPVYQKTKAIRQSNVEIAKPIKDLHDFKWNKEHYMIKFIHNYFFGGFIPEQQLCRAVRNDRIFTKYEDFIVTTGRNLDDEILNHFNKLMEGAKETVALEEIETIIKLWRNSSLKRTK